jgi:hypothetical protein
MGTSVGSNGCEVIMMRFLKRSPMFWIGLFLVAFGGIFTSVGWSLMRTEQQYRQEGQTVDGVVLVKAIERATRTGSNRSRTEYTVTYRFSASDGQSYEGQSSVPVATWERLREQDRVQIQYVASNPTTSRVSGESNISPAYVFPTIGLIAALIGAVLLSRSLRSAAAKTRILSQGTAANATVSAVEETNVKVNRRPMWVVHYQYRDHSGQTHDGKSEYMSGDKASAWKQGDSIRVKFDPQKPGASVWVE